MDTRRKVKYYIKAYIPCVIDYEDDDYYVDASEAISDANNMEAMQPENIYEVVKVTTDEDGHTDEETISTINMSVGGD